MAKLSVVMPVYNAEKYLVDAIESILNQTFKDFEFIIVNDASTDNSKAIIQRYAKKDKRIKLLNNENNLHIGGSLNRGIKYANSDFIARMDGDDIAMPDRFEKQYKLISGDSNLGAIGGYIQTIDEDGAKLEIRKYSQNSKVLKSRIFRYLPFAHPSVVFRKKAWEEFGGYDPTKSPSEDMDLWIKIGTKYDFSNVQEVVLRYRVFENSFSNKKLKEVEMNTIKMRYSAWRDYGYKPSLMDLFYNFSQFVTMWIMPTKFRLKLFNFLRNNKLI